MAGQAQVRIIIDLLEGRPASPPRGVSQAYWRQFRGDMLVWRRGAGVVGVGLGVRRVNGVIAGDPTLRIFVKQKRPRARIAVPIPRRIDVPGMERAIWPDVEEVGILAPLQGGGDPILGGSRIRHANDGEGRFGTLGCLVRDANNPSNHYLLSNAHVIAQMGQGNTGDSVVLDNSDGQIIANLTASVAPQSGGAANFADVAIAQVASNRVQAEIMGHAGPTGISSMIFAGMKVHKIGAKSGRTASQVTDVHCALDLEYSVPNGNPVVYRFLDQVICEPFSQGGDSGSAVLNARGRVVGLLFWGSNRKTVFSPISNVLDAFAPAHELEIVTAPAGPELMSETDIATFEPDEIPVDPRFRIPNNRVAVLPSGAAPDLPPVTDRERATDLLARTLWGEARGEGQSGMEAVADVIVNRAKVRPQRWWGATIEAVCLKKFQFSCWNESDPNLAKLKAVTPVDANFAIALDIAISATDGRISDLTNGATHYHTVSNSPDWADATKRTATIGRHHFYKGIN